MSSSIDSAREGSLDYTPEERWVRWVAESAARDRRTNRRMSVFAWLVGCGVAVWLVITLIAR